MSLGGRRNGADVASKYRFMESNSLSRKSGLEDKVPELERSIEMVSTLSRKKAEGDPFEMSFELSDTLYAKGVAEEVDEVYIWLGVSGSGVGRAR